MFELLSLCCSSVHIHQGKLTSGAEAGFKIELPFAVDSCLRLFVSSFEMYSFLYLFNTTIRRAPWLLQLCGKTLRMADV